MSRAEPLPALTGLRFWAALHVVVFHFGAAWLDGAPGWLQAIQQCGYASVGLFFVLSGFVLSYNYLGPDGRMAVEPRTFWSARIARIYPVYVLALVLLAPHVIAGSMAANSVGMAAAKLAVGGGSALLAPVYALLVYGLARGGGALGWLLSRPLGVRLGEASYALYILHHPVWLAVGAVAGAAAPWVDLSSPRALFAVFLPVALTVSWLSHRYVEVPLRGWIRRALQSWTERSQRAAAVEPGA